MHQSMPFQTANSELYWRPAASVSYCVGVQSTCSHIPHDKDMDTRTVKGM